MSIFEIKNVDTRKCKCRHFSRIYALDECALSVGWSGVVRWVQKKVGEQFPDLQVNNVLPINYKRDFIQLATASGVKPNFSSRTV